MTKPLWAVGGIALVTRLMVAFLLDGMRNPDVQEYDVIARNLIAGRGFTYFNHGIPIYSALAPLPVWLAAASYWLIGSLVGVMTLQVLAGAASAVAAAWMAARLFGGSVAPLAAGILVALHPGLAVYDASRAHALSFDVLFFTLVLLQSFRVGDRPTAGRSAVLGVLVGLGMLSRATVLVFLPLAIVWLLVVKRAPWRRTLAAALIAGSCAAAVVAPWTIRNSMLHDRFVLLLTTDGDNFWRGNNPHASGTSYVDPTRTVLSTLSDSEVRELEQQPDELAQNAWFKARAWAFIRENPGKFVRLFFTKLYFFWWYAPTTGILYPASWFQAYLAYYSIAVVFAMVGLWRISRASGTARADTILLVTFAIVLSAVQSLYYVEGRHRWAIEPMLLVLSGGGLAAARHWFSPYLR